MKYCIYLRKSRADEDAEQRGEGETLARHERLLLELAKKLKVAISKIYREIVSGESIASRPVMQQLLTEVEQGMWGGVLVVEIERLARGNTIDQGIIAQAFKFSGTKIITPTKTYDPDNEWDEEYFEFGLFMSRREYKAINRRLQRGREASAKEGKFVGSIAPYGYKRVKLECEKGYTLEIVPEHAEIVRLIFSLYTGENRVGMQHLARMLNEMGIPPIRHDYWQKETIKDILTNPAYAGIIRWGYRKVVKRQTHGQIKKSRPINYNDDCITAKGRHEPIVSEEMFAKAQNYIKEIPPPPVKYKNRLINPIAGLIKCGKCKRSMAFRRKPSANKKDYIVCHARACDNVSAPFELVEKRLIESLAEWLSEYKLKWEDEAGERNRITDTKEKALKGMYSELETLNKQMNNLYDLLEQGVYSTDTFLERSRLLTEKIKETDNRIQSLETELSKSKTETINKNIIPKIEHLLEVYYNLQDIEIKNNMLKEVLDKAIYSKSVNGAFKGRSADDFELLIYPKLLEKQ